MKVINTHVSQHCHTFILTTTFAKVAMLCFYALIIKRKDYAVNIYSDIISSLTCLPHVSRTVDEALIRRPI